MAPSPPKPWERASAPSAASSVLSSASPSSLSSQSPATSSPATSTSAAPALPERPAAMSNPTATMGYGAAGSSSVYPTATTSPYSSAYSSPYSSPYNRFGAGAGAGYGSYGSSFGAGGYGGYGSYGGLGGGYGSMGGYGGMGGYGMGMGGMGMGMGGMGGMYPPGMGSPEELSLSQRMEAGTAATFQMLQAIVGAFGGFAQMLESTFMATHSSFFAMIGVAEQFGHLRNYLGQVLSVFALIRWVQGLLYRLAGRTPPGEGISADGFRAFEATGGAPAGANGTPAKAKLAKRPLVVFLLTVIGLPWLMNRLVRLITARQEAEAARLAASGQGGFSPQPQFDQFGRPLPPSAQQATPSVPLDPSQLLFLRALHAYTPPPSSADKELAFAPNDIIAIVTPKEERERNGGQGWWMGRTRDGRTGWVPSSYLGEVPGLGKGKDGKEGEGETHGKKEEAKQVQ
ncbi:hypothetical protein JCM21900_002572 [Sporobolomyces salmonicolor]